MIEKPNFVLQRLDKTRDIGQMAELIDLCFGQQMDPDGKKYLNYLRNLARQNHSLVSLFEDSISYSPSIDGFVCKANDRLIGNVNISLYQDVKEKILFISNVAVHPDYRNQGIAKQMVQKAIDFAIQHQFSSIWLQVRKENEIAYHVYASIGFKDWGIRDTWVIQPSFSSRGEKLPKMLITRRRTVDWQKQEEWLNNIYPQEIRWQLEINSLNLRPHIWQSINNAINGRIFLHWSFVFQQQLVGVITWQPSFRFADQLLLAVEVGFEDKLINDAFPFVQRQLMRKKPLMLDLPEGFASNVLPNVGFEKMNTLRWMKRQIN
jgi:ribosomal protein S18 acetylase RimI-like enzyme